MMLTVIGGGWGVHYTILPFSVIEKLYYINNELKYIEVRTTTGCAWHCNSEYAHSDLERAAQNQCHLNYECLGEEERKVGPGLGLAWAKPWKHERVLCEASL